MALSSQLSSLRLCSEDQQELCRQRGHWALTSADPRLQETCIGRRLSRRPGQSLVQRSSTSSTEYVLPIKYRLLRTVVWALGLAV